MLMFTSRRPPCQQLRLSSLFCNTCIYTSVILFQKSDTRCKCGARICRGTMDSQPERLKDYGKRIEIFWEGDDVYYRGTVTGFSATTNRHTILYDDNDVERICLEVKGQSCMEYRAPFPASLNL